MRDASEEDPDGLVRPDGIPACGKFPAIAAIDLIEQRKMQIARIYEPADKRIVYSASELSTAKHFRKISTHGSFLATDVRQAGIPFIPIP